MSKAVEIKEVENGLLYTWRDDLGNWRTKVCLNSAAIGAWVVEYFGPEHCAEQKISQPETAAS